MGMRQLQSRGAQDERLLVFPVLPEEAPIAQDREPSETCVVAVACSLPPRLGAVGIVECH